METDRSIDAVKAEPFSDICGDSTRNQSDGNDLADELLDVGAPIADLQLPAKMKKSFKLFNMKRGILPNFFSKKDNGKGLCKRVISKSKTHDGIIDAEQCEGKKESIQNSSNGEKDLHNRSHDKTLTNSQSAHCDINTNLKLDFQKGSSLECIHKNLSADKFSASPRPKKGLRGLLSSIRRHKKKVLVQRDDCDFTTIKDNSTGSLHLEHVNNKHEKESMLGKKLHNNCGSELAQTMLPNTSVDKDNRTVPLESASDEKALATDVSTGACKETVLTKETKDKYKDSSLSGKTEGTAIYRNSQFSSLPDIVNSGYTDSDPPSLHLYDQVSVIFDVTSLKSFDSLTGCGDIIADQDDDSIADTASADRSKNAAKRSSCLVTYQGGGEEMATPDEVDEDYLQELWEDAENAAGSYEAELLQSIEHPEPKHSSDQLVSEIHANISHPGLTRAAVENVDLLTPQSEQQESAPNSDEGYYDSNTPGALDEGGDGFNQTKKDRLPRDSYSGDALYELYDPDDSPMNPSFEESLDSKIPSLNTAETFFNLSEKADNFSKFFSQKVGVMETEEERLAVIQQQLLCWELKRMNVSTSKALDLLDKAKRAIEKQTTECDNKSEVTNMLGKMQQNCFAGEQLILQSSNQTIKGNIGAPPRTDKKNWISPCRKNSHEGSESQVLCVRYSSEKLYKDTPCDSDTVNTELEQASKLSSQQADDHLEFLKMSVSGNIGVINNGKRLENYPSTEQEKFRGEYEQAVNFSQALVEFTSNGTLFPTLSENLDCSDSGSFTQSLPSLPVMVTFDVVDVENEGGCDQQIEMSTADEIETSFEAFDDSYVQKESFADYDDRMFHANAYNSFSNSWGVTSLPRHLSLYRMDPSISTPLPLNRRSRSLDTDSLESELSNVPLPKGRIPSLELQKAEWRGRKVSKGCPLADSKCNTQSVYSEMKETTGIEQYASSQQGQVNMPGDGKGQNVSMNYGVVKDSCQHLDPKETSLPFVPPEQRHSKHSCSKGSRNTEHNSVPTNLRHVERPSHLPLPTDYCRSQKGVGIHRNSRESTYKKQTFGPAAEEKCGVRFLPRPAVEGKCGVSFLPRPAGNLCLNKPPKCKPVGVTQGVPQSHGGSAENLKLSHSTDQYSSGVSKSPCKGKNEHAVTLPAGCNKHCKVKL